MLGRANNNFGQINNNDQSTILFCRNAVTSIYSFGNNPSQADEANPQQLYLLSKLCESTFFDSLPKNFTISTKNSTCHFNLEMLKETSPVISNFVIEHPNEMHYTLNINDDENALSKFEQLFLGKAVIFDEDEIPTSQRITKMLKIKNCPNFLKPESLRTNEIDSNGNSVFNPANSKVNVIIYQKYLINYLSKDELLTFKIKTKKKEYKCSIYGVYSSKVIQQILNKDPNFKEYIYDIEDEYDEFQSICDFFNFKKVEITSNNMDSLKEIAEDLQINCIIKQIDDYINNYEKFTQKIDEQQTIIDSIDQLFDLLYNINRHGIEKVKISILQSKWSKKEENVQELAAFILQIVKPSFLLQKEMADLIIQLSKESNETNELNILMPFIIDKLMTFYMPSFLQISTGTTTTTNSSSKSFGTKSFGTSTFRNNLKSPFEFSSIQESINYNNKCIFNFIRILYKKGIIPKEDIIEKLKKYNCFNKNFNAFFLPELIEINPKNAISLSSTFNSSFGGFGSNLRNSDLFFKKYLPDKIDLYEKMLDNMESDDELTKSIQHDDVDTLQTIITSNEIDISNYKIPYNIFDDFEENVNITNYAAYYGALKCFKYLLLNNGTVDETTLYFAVYGGNIEIIKIVDQRTNEIDNSVIKIDNNKLGTMGTFTFGNSFTNSIFWFNNINNNNNNNNKFGTGFGSNFGGMNNNNNNNFNEDDNLQTTKLINNIPICCLNFDNVNNIIASTIALHRNDLFDWIFEKKFVSKAKIGTALNKIALLSASHGNAHALIEMIDKGFDISSLSSKDVIFYSARNGFSQLTQLLLSIIEQKNKKQATKLSNKKQATIFNDLFNNHSIVKFGNLSIFKMFIKQMNQNSIEQSILYAIDLGYKKIVDFYFDNFSFSQQKSFITSALIASLKKKTGEFFNYLLEKFKKINPDLFNLELYKKLLDNSCLYSNLIATKIITDLILIENPNNDFSSAFIQASSSSGSNICQYFIDKKVYINYSELSSRVYELGSIDEELFVMIINNVSPNIKHRFLRCITRAIQKKNKKLIEFLLKQKAPMKDTLFEAVLTHDLEIVDLILKYNSKPSFINEKKSEGTAIQIATMNKDKDIVKRLLSIPGINPSLYNQQGENALIIAITNYDIDIVNDILDFYGDDIQLNTLNNVMNYLINCCGMQSINNINNNNDKNMWKIVKRFIEIKSFDPNYMEQCTLLYKASFNNEIEMVESLLNLDNIDVNKYELNLYNTPLMIAIEKKNLRIAELLINFPKTDLNLRNIYDESALVKAVKNDLYDIVDLIVKNDRFDPFESRLNYAFIFANIEMAKKLASLDFLDVNEVCEIENNSHLPNSKDKIPEISALINSVKVNDVEKIDLIINHHSFDKNKSDINKAIFAAVKDNNIDIFKILMKLIDNDINIRNQRGESLLVVAAMKLSGDIIDEIFMNPKFDPKDNQICSAFVESFSVSKHHQSFLNNNNVINNFGGIPHPQYGFGMQQNMNQNRNQIYNQQLIPAKSTIIEIMNKILAFDNEHEHLIDFTKFLPDGKSFFTAICSNYDEIKIVSDFLIEHGVDPNVPDKKNKYPLEHAINLNSLDFVTSLVNSNKIDYSKYKDGSTYLHLAAKTLTSSILRFLLEKDVIDINSENKNGETPLMVACRSKLIDNIDLFFEKNNLDYLHCNKDGKDALSLIISSPQNEVNNTKLSKEAYKNKLTTAINEFSLDPSSNNSFGFNNNNIIQVNKEEEEDKDDLENE